MWTGRRSCGLHLGVSWSDTNGAGAVRQAVRRAAEKHQNPNIKHQINTKLQKPRPCLHTMAEFAGSGSWNLDLGVSLPAGEWW